MSIKKRISAMLPTFFVPLICAIFYSLGWFVRSSMNVLAAKLEMLYGFDIATIGFISSGFYLTYTFMQIPVGFLVDRYGIKNNIVFSILSFTCGAFVFYCSKSSSLLYLARALMGFGSSFAFVSSIKSMYLYLPKRLHSFYNSLLQVFCAGGILLAGEPFLLFITKNSVSKAFFVVMLIGIGLASLASFLPKNKEEFSYRVSILDQLKEAFVCFKEPQILVNALFCFTICTGTALFVELWGIEYITIKYNSELATTVYKAGAIGTALFSMLWGFLLRTFKQQQLMVWSSIIALITSLLLLYVKLPTAILIPCAFIFAGMQTSHIICFLRIGHYVPAAYVGITLAFVNTFIPLGQSLMQPISGLILNSMKQLPKLMAFNYTLMIIPILMIISIIISHKFLEAADV